MEWLSVLRNLTNGKGVFLYPQLTTYISRTALPQQEADIRHTAQHGSGFYHSFTADKLRRGVDGGIYEWERREGIFSPRRAARAIVLLLRRTPSPQTLRRQRKKHDTGSLRCESIRACDVEVRQWNDKVRNMLQRNGKTDLEGAVAKSALWPSCFNNL